MTMPPMKDKPRSSEAIGWLAFASLALSSVIASQGSAAAQNTPVNLRSVLDRNQDGQVDAAEIEAAPRHLAALDRDGDKALAPDEFGAPRRGRGFGGRRGGPPGMPPGFPPGGPPGMPPGGAPTAAGNPFDTNRDGRTDADEVSAAAKTLRRLDGNRDGLLGKREFDHAFPAPSVGDDADMGGFGRGAARAATMVEPEALDPADGLPTIEDRASFERLAYQGDEVMIDTQLRRLEFVKFVITGAGGPTPKLWFMNTKKWRAHPMFMGAMGIDGGGRGFGRPSDMGSGAAAGTATMRGVLVYRPLLKAPDASMGLYTFEFEPNDAYPFRLIESAFDVLGAKSELLRGRMAYHPIGPAIRVTEAEKALYEKRGIGVFGDDDLYRDIAFLPLHRGKSYGRLRFMKVDERPEPRDVVVYAALPNDLPRVAGILTAVRQTPLSHVNLRAVQVDVPNAYVAAAASDERLRDLAGKWVELEVRADGYSVREVDAAVALRHFEGLRPRMAPRLERDLSVMTIRSLDEVGHADWRAVGVKAANLAELRKLDLPLRTVDFGFAIPFSFYDEFMRANGLYDVARAMIEVKDFGTPGPARARALADLRKKIEKGKMPVQLEAAIAAVQARFAEGMSIRCRSSTNNEDLPAFSGAGLYDSFTHKPSEGHLAKTVRQVWASLWTERAFDERDFYRIDHFATAMGVLLHPNFAKERINGVAVSSDVVYESEQTNYINVAVGEDLVTNPSAEANPEEALLSKADWRLDRVVRYATTSPGKSLLSTLQQDDLREALAKIERHFREVLDLAPEALFAIEVEFKVTAANKLVIKQARPWVY